MFVLDISMLEQNGFAVARVPWGMPASREARIIALTALGKAGFVAIGPVVEFDGECQKRGSHHVNLRSGTDSKSFTKMHGSGGSGNCPASRIQLTGALPREWTACEWVVRPVCACL